MVRDSDDAGDGSERQSLRALLERVALFRDVPREALEVLLPQFRRRDLPAGTVIIEQGDSGDELFLVEDGVLDVSAHVRGKPVRLGRLGPGDIFGEMALLRESPRTATVTATTAARAWSLSRDALADVDRSVPAIGQRLRAVMRRRDLTNALRALQ